MEITDFQSKLREAVTNIEKYGLEYADAKAVSWQLQEQKKVVLAEEQRKQDPKLSLGEKESRARLSDAYRLHLEGTKEAIGEELRAKAKLERWKAQMDAIRSLCSLTKESMKELGH